MTEPRRPREPRRPEPDLDAIFGDVLPDTTGDEREPDRPDSPDEWYERNRPPHHDS